MTTAADFMALPPAAFAPSRHPLSKDIAAGEYPVTPPAVLRLVAAEDQLTEQAEQFAAPSETYAAWLARTAAELVDGAPLPDLAANAQRLIAQDETRRVGGLAVAHLRQDINGRWTTTLLEHADEMLAGLAASLAEILTAVNKAAAVIDGLDITDGESVAAASKEQLQAIGRLKELRPRYRRLRHLQEALLSATSEVPPVGWGQGGWVGLFRTRVHEFSNIAHNGLPSEDLPSALWFRRLLHRDDVWLPTLTEMGEALTPTEPRRVQHANPSPDVQADVRYREGAIRSTVALLSLND